MDNELFYILSVEILKKMSVNGIISQKEFEDINKHNIDSFVPNMGEIVNIYY